MDILVYALLNKKIRSSLSGISDVKYLEESNELEFTNVNDGGTFTVSLPADFHIHDNANVLEALGVDDEGYLTLNGVRVSSGLTSEEIEELIAKSQTGLDADLTDYYTRSEVDTIINGLDIPQIDATTVATKEEMVAADTSTLESAKAYTDEIIANLDTGSNIDLTDYYTKTEVDDLVDSVEVDGSVDLTDYYTKTEVDDLIDGIEVDSNIDLTDYYTKTEVDDLIDGIEIDGNVDLTDYYTKTEVDTLVGNVEVDMTNYYTKAEVEDLMPETIDTTNFATKTEVTTGDEAVKTYVDEEIAKITITDTTNYYTKTEVDTLIDNVDVDLTDYSTTEQINTAIETAINEIHTHENQEVLDNFSYDETSGLLYDGSKIGGETDLADYYTKTETDEAITEAISTSETNSNLSFRIMSW